MKAYLRSRPGYPKEVIDTLREECGLTSRSVIADVGSGTGLLTRLFLVNGNLVYAVEPNAEMRAAAEELLGDQPGFRSVDGKAEATTLTDDRVDFVTAGQSFHWFDRNLARSEFERVLKPGGWVALVWNDRDLQSSAFMQSYEDLLRRFGTDYHEVDHTIDAEVLLQEFYSPGPMKSNSFPNRQIFDYPGLEGRLLSTSYAPDPSHSNFGPMMKCLKHIFEDHAEDGLVVFKYTTRLYYGQLNERRH